jgi:hypothetical protein
VVLSKKARKQKVAKEAEQTNSAPVKAVVNKTAASTRTAAPRALPSVAFEFPVVGRASSAPRKPSAAYMGLKLPPAATDDEAWTEVLGKKGKKMLVVPKKDEFACARCSLGRQTIPAEKRVEPVTTEHIYDLVVPDTSESNTDILVNTEKQAGIVIPEALEQAKLASRVFLTDSLEDSDSDTDINPAFTFSNVDVITELLVPSESAFDLATYQPQETLYEHFEIVVEVDNLIDTITLPASAEQHEIMILSTDRLEEAFDYAALESRFSLYHGFDYDATEELAVDTAVAVGRASQHDGLVEHTFDYAIFKSRMNLRHGFEDHVDYEEHGEVVVYTITSEQPVAAIFDDADYGTGPAELTFDFVTLESPMALQHGTDDDPKDGDVSGLAIDGLQAPEMNSAQQYGAEFGVEESQFHQFNDSDDFPRNNEEAAASDRTLPPSAAVEDTMDEEHMVVELDADTKRLCDIALAEMIEAHPMSEKVCSEQMISLEETLAYGHKLVIVHESTSLDALAKSIDARQALSPKATKGTAMSTNPTPRVKIASPNIGASSNYKIEFPKAKLTYLLKSLGVENGRVTLEAVAMASVKCAEDEVIRRVKARPRF